MSFRRNSSDFLIQQKTLLGSTLRTKDPSYLPYVGADWLDAETVACLQFIKNDPILKNRPRTKANIDRVLLYYEERRKAFFMTLGSDILTKIAYLVGENRNVVNANRRRKADF